MSNGSLTSAGDDDRHELALSAVDVSTIADRKDQALLVLKSDLMEKLNEAVRSLDDDGWMFEGPRSRIHLISKQDKLRLSPKETVTIAGGGESVGGDGDDSEDGFNDGEGGGDGSDRVGGSRKK